MLGFILGARSSLAARNSFNAGLIRLNLDPEQWLKHSGARWQNTGFVQNLSYTNFFFFPTSASFFCQNGVNWVCSWNKSIYFRSIYQMSHTSNLTLLYSHKFLAFTGSGNVLHLLYYNKIHNLDAWLWVINWCTTCKKNPWRNSFRPHLCV